MLGRRDWAVPRCCRVVAVVRLPVVLGVAHAIVGDVGGGAVSHAARCAIVVLGGCWCHHWVLFVPLADVAAVVKISVSTK